jgi:hypothetical protein
VRERESEKTNKVLIGKSFTHSVSHSAYFLESFFV